MGFLGDEDRGSGGMYENTVLDRDEEDGDTAIQLLVFLQNHLRK